MIDSSDMQMSSRYPRELADQAHDYACEHKLPIKVVLCAALAEYLARREDGTVDPAPQLHYRRGRPSATLLALQAQLMHVDPRGRKIRRANAPRRSVDGSVRVRPRQRLGIVAGTGLPDA